MFRHLQNSIKYWTVFLSLIACGIENPVLPGESASFSLDSTDPQQCTPASESFRAGQHIDIGSVNIWNDATTLFVNLTISDPDSWYLAKSHVNISGSLDDVPKSGGGAPVNGHFTVQHSHSESDYASYTYEFPLAEYDFDPIYILTHAEANRYSGGGETAYGGDQDWPFGNRWAYYTEYSRCATSDNLNSISGLVHWDVNENGAHDSGESGISGITVHLLDEAGQIVSQAITDSAGNYSFTGIPSGNYSVVIDPDGVLGQLDTQNPSSHSVSLAGGDAAALANGYYLPRIITHSFFDINQNGVMDADEIGLDGITVSVSPSGGSIASDGEGEATFKIYPGSYQVVFGDVDGLFNTTDSSVSVVVGYANAHVYHGKALDLISLCGQAAGGFTIGYWKNNLTKALQGRTKGIQVDAQSLLAYTNLIASFALSPYQDIDMNDAVSFLGARGSEADLLLAKQLLGSEYNYFNGAYIGGAALITKLFVYQGEFVLKNFSDYSRDEVLYYKDWYDAYNNSHGGAVNGPGCEL